MSTVQDEGHRHNLLKALARELLHSGDSRTSAIGYRLEELLNRRTKQAAGQYSVTQINRWCRCGADLTHEDCPLHGIHIIEWQCFDDRDQETLGESFVSSDMRADLPGGQLAAALWSAEREQQMQIPYRGTVHLAYRTISNWNHGNPEDK